MAAYRHEPGMAGSDSVGMDGDMMNYLAPRKAKARDTSEQNCEAWWYGERAGIDIYIRALPNGPTVACWITKRQLKAWLASLESAP